jgi:ribonucleoside-diphosphate reductase alpha chain
MVYSKQQIDSLNKALKTHYPHIFPADLSMKKSLSGVSRLVMLDRYAQKDVGQKTITIGDLVVCIAKDDPKFPARGIGNIEAIVGDEAVIVLEEEYYGSAPDQVNGRISRKLSQIDKPLELFYEQIATRVGTNLSDTDVDKKQMIHEIAEQNIVPAGRVLFGAGSQANVTYFNCYVMPYVHDSRGGIAKHREQVMEIMSRGGGVGTNGSTLRPKHALARGVNGRSSGAVSWLNDISGLTNLVEQGGSRRGAQMIMLADWHPDIIEFIISKMQNPKILRFLKETIADKDIRQQADQKLRFVPLSDAERDMYETVLQLAQNGTHFSKETIANAETLYAEGGRYEVQQPDFLTGANISVAITREFMQAVEDDAMYDLRFPDVDNYTPEQKAAYNADWQQIGDVREWEKMGYPVKVYKTIKAKDLWNLINVCATYAAEPGIFFIDNANEKTNAVGYDQKVVCTNPCGEQPLAPYSVCNLAALNLANFVDKQSGEILWEKLKQTIYTSIRMQDNVIDRTYYFLEDNKRQALGERRIGMGVMGLHDMILWTKTRYGSPESLELIDELFEFIAVSAYRASIELAKEKGSYPFLATQANREKMIRSGFIQGLPKDIQNDILKYGIRNSHLLTVAPTGSTGTMVGVATGLEPYFAFKYYRSGRLGRFIEVDAPIVEEFAKEHPSLLDGINLPDFFVSANDLAPEEHVDVQTRIQRWVDSSISKTVNAPKGYSVSQVERVYSRLYKGGAKGGTVYVDGSRDAQVLTLTAEENTVQLDLVNEYSLEIDEKRVNVREDKSTVAAPLKNDRQGREIGAEVGDICPICNEGTVVESGGCNTCNNCNAQLKCGL